MSEAKEAGMPSHAEHANGYNGTTAYTGQPKKRGLFGKYAHSWRTHWWVHLLVIAGIILIVTLPVIYVGYPNIAQSEINKSKLNVTNQVTINPTPNSFDLNLTTEIITHSIYHPDIYEFDAALHLGDSEVPFVVVPVPKVHSRNHAPLVSLSHQTITNNNSDAFTEYSKTLFLNESLRIRVTGKPRLKLKGLFKVSVNYKKYVTIAGFNALQGVRITNLTASLQPFPDGSNLIGQMYIPNPTVQTIELGNVTFTLSVPGNVTNSTEPTPLGTAKITNVVSRPGGNVYEARSVTNQTALLSLIQKNPKIAGPDGLPLMGLVSNVTKNGVVIPYLLESLSSGPLLTNLNIEDALKQVGLGGLIPGASSSSSSATPTSSSAGGFGGFPSASSSAPFLGFPSSSSSQPFLGFPTSSSAAPFFGFPTSSSSQAFFGFPTSTSAPFLGFPQSTSTISSGSFPFATKA